MNDPATTLSHEEITLLLFALQGGDAAPLPDLESCEEACPVVESVEELLCGGKINPEHQLVRHLNNHIREALIESGLFELMATARNGDAQGFSAEQRSSLDQANQRLKQWSSEVRFNADERLLLAKALSRMPPSAWLMMPRTLWQLRKKLKSL
ncbi:MAG TPA: hypothetical protein VNS63_11755 [Blastocatellia bacterium]|nr:hypothetical protein [Blastocatellia bacterium]